MASKLSPNHPPKQSHKRPPKLPPRSPTDHPQSPPKLPPDRTHFDNNLSAVAGPHTKRTPPYGINIWTKTKHIIASTTIWSSSWSPVGLHLALMASPAPPWLYLLRFPAGSWKGKGFVEKRRKEGGRGEEGSGGGGKVRAWLGFQEQLWKPVWSLQAPQAPSGDPLEAQLGCQRPLRTLCSPRGYP